MSNMSTYLSAVTADYNYTLDLPGHDAMPEVGEKRQELHRFDSGAVSVVTISPQSYFNVRVKWVYLDSTDRATIFDLWHDAAKGNGMARTWYWKHHGDEQTYTVRFMSPLSRVWKPADLISVDEITIRIEGVKPA